MVAETAMMMWLPTIGVIRSTCFNNNYWPYVNQFNPDVSVYYLDTLGIYNVYLQIIRADKCWFVFAYQLSLISIIYKKILLLFTII